jgi:SAM-dependent methyltransferase
MKKIIKNIDKSEKLDKNFYSFNPKGYWSNLDKDDNENFIQDIKKRGTKIAVKNLRKDFLYDVIFSKKRGRGIDLLNIKGNEVAVDFGCMWGALTIPLAKKVKKVIAVDQTKDSLFFLSKRSKENKLKNIFLLQENLRKINLKKSSINIAIVNGVLEWIAETNQVVVDKYLNKREKKKNDYSIPGNIQKKFLKKIFNSLKENGQLYLAIENRYDYKMFFGLKDPHNGTLFTTIFPKSISNIISLLFKGKPYRTWIYSYSQLNKILIECGFKSLKFYSAWPDYRIPDQILEYDSNFKNFKICSKLPLKKITTRKKIAGFIEFIIFKIFKLKQFSPSIIVIAKK